MLPELNKIKGIHPGAILNREIKKRGLKNKDFASMVNEHAQTISAIIKEKRGVNPKLSIKLGMNLGVDVDYFMLLQASYDVKQASISEIVSKTPDLNKIRKILFWDTDFDKIDWQRNKRAIIKRVFERGNETEIKEILKFYGKETVKAEIENIKESYLTSFALNIDRYLR
ncbi:helix-turn-helix transcriptional regulator [Plebeiibacterium marinum]|uniref:Helix-turn-helix domain-containing protein n=1 Tax=Plebeiibacterium marinum TaxID=2992111 RepID=A0AAE3SJS2_9BACT|nr:helix-turn-helix domain-containing protein [Plebeiobacterium marinum]MCW3805718.1 helix-turn-helix domain-containing protein [Plebeiobacterium marinum]